MGVTTMKMISRTSITSTMGVTLMSEVTFAPSFRFAKDIYLLLLRHHISAANTRPKSTPPEVRKARRWKPPAPDQQLTADYPTGSC
jgi:hypothetical protein